MDISATLISLLQGYPWGASAVAVIGVVGYALTHLFPLLPKPAPGATGAWPTLYGVLSALAGNWGNAANAPAAAQPPVRGAAT